jgi:hypothetical protein
MPIKIVPKEDKKLAAMARSAAVRKEMMDMMRAGSPTPPKVHRLRR